MNDTTPPDDSEHNAPLADSSSAPSVDISSPQSGADLKAQQAPRPLRKWMDQMTPPQSGGALTEEEKLAQGTRDLKIGCFILIALCIVAVLFWHYWRSIFRAGGFLVPAALILLWAIRAKKVNGCLILSALLAGGIGYYTMTGIVGIVGGADLKNPPAAIDKIVRSELPNDIEYIKVERNGGDLDGYYSVNISYHYKGLMDAKGALTDIQLQMAKTYRGVLRYKELPVSYFKINAQLEMQDRFGNAKGWTDAYRTQLDLDTIKHLNRDNLDSVNFENLWEEVFVHPSLSR